MPYAGPPEQPLSGSGTLDATGTATGPIAIDPPKPLPPVVTGAEIDGRYARDFQPLYPSAEQRAGVTEP